MKSARKKTSKKKASKKKVLHISRFHQRYELSEDIRYDRKSPLLFTKDFVGSGSDNESCSYWKQLIELRSKPNWLEYRGAFAELKNIAGNTSKVYRGFLLNSNFGPASVREVGRWLGVNEKQASKIIAGLEEVGLLEWLDLPVFETDETKNKPKKRKKKSPAKQAKAHRKSGRSRKRTKNSGSARERTGKPGGARAGTGTHGKARAPLKEKTNVKANVKGKGKTNDNDNINKEIKNGNGNRIRIGENDALSSPEAPATAPPIQSQVSAENGGARLIKLPAPSAVFNNRDEAQAIGDIVVGLKHRYSSEAKAFAADIYEALGLHLTFSPLTVRGRRELGSFASVWERAEANGLSPVALARLRCRALDEALKVAKRRSRCGNVSAVWCHVFGRLLSAAGYRGEAI